MTLIAVVQRNGTWVPKLDGCDVTLLQRHCASGGLCSWCSTCFAWPTSRRLPGVIEICQGRRWFNTKSTTRPRKKRRRNDTLAFIYRGIMSAIGVSASTVRITTLCGWVEKLWRPLFRPSKLTTFAAISNATEAKLHRASRPKLLVYRYCTFGFPR